MSVALASAFYGQMTANTGAGTFYAAVGGRIRFGEGKENDTLPLAVYRIAESPVEQQFGGRTFHRPRIVVDIYSAKDDGAEAAMAMDDKLYAQCNQIVVATVSGYDRATIVCESRGSIEALEDAFVVSSAWEVIGNTT